MTTAGIHLESLRSAGGSFQYSQSLLDALQAGQCADRSAFAFCLDTLSSECDPAHVDIPLIAYRSLGIGERVAGRLLRRCGAYRLPAGRGLHSRLSPLGRSLRERSVDVCIYPYYEHYAIELATKSLVPIHDLMHRYEPDFSMDRPAGDPDPFLRMLCEGADALLADSMVGKRHITESYGIDPEKIHVLPYIPSRAVLALASLTGSGTTPLPPGVPEKYLYYPAQQWFHKNHVRLVDAVLEVRRNYPDVHVVFAGGAQAATRSLEQHIADRDAWSAITMLGYVDDATNARLIAAARALVMPTFFGPTNIPPIEACALGTPAAVSDIYAMRERLGDAVLYFDPNSTSQISDAVERLWTDDTLVKSLAAKGLNLARTWGPTQFADRLWSIIDQLST